MSEAEPGWRSWWPKGRYGQRRKPTSRTENGCAMPGTSYFMQKQNKMEKIEEKSLFHYMVDEMAEQLKTKTLEDEKRAFIMLAIDKKDGEFAMSYKTVGSPIMLMRLLLGFFGNKSFKDFFDNIPNLVAAVKLEDDENRKNKE